MILLNKIFLNEKLKKKVKTRKLWFEKSCPNSAPYLLIYFHSESNWNHVKPYYNIFNERKICLSLHFYTGVYIPSIYPYRQKSQKNFLTVVEDEHNSLFYLKHLEHFTHFSPRLFWEKRLPQIGYVTCSSFELSSSLVDTCGTCVSSSVIWTQVIFLHYLFGRLLW